MLTSAVNVEAFAHLLFGVYVYRLHHVGKPREFIHSDIVVYHLAHNAQLSRKYYEALRTRYRRVQHIPRHKPSRTVEKRYYHGSVFAPLTLVDGYCVGFSC